MGPRPFSCMQLPWRSPDRLEGSRQLPQPSQLLECLASLEVDGSSTDTVFMAMVDVRFSRFSQHQHVIFLSLLSFSRRLFLLCSYYCQDDVSPRPARTKTSPAFLALLLLALVISRCPAETSANPTVMPIFPNLLDLGYVAMKLLP